MIKKWIYLAGFLLFVLSCNTDKSCFKFVEDGRLIVQLNDRSGNNLIAAWGTRYDSDSVKLLSEDGKLYATATGDISFSVVSTTDPPVNKKLSNTCYLRLPPWQGNPNVDIDTIDYN